MIWGRENSKNGRSRGAEGDHDWTIFVVTYTILPLSEADRGRIVFQPPSQTIAALCHSDISAAAERLQQIDF